LEQSLLKNPQSFKNDLNYLSKKIFAMLVWTVGRQFSSLHKNGEKKKTKKKAT